LNMATSWVVALAKRGVLMADLVQRSEEWAEVLSH